MSPDGAITDPKSLAALGHFQNAVAELPGVQAVIGPSQAAKRGERCRTSATPCSPRKGTSAR
ncbi:MAG TPA: hypothetical protein VHM66_05035 [Solirubrobacterales bacterium]|nr:hypothetical protein [Solirubrobacterales bacterium]